MADYTPPLESIRFALQHAAGLGDLVKLPGFAHADLDTLHDLVGEAGRFMAEVVAPLSAEGDRVGAQLADGEVHMPDGYAEAYARYVEAGWGSIAIPEEHGGAGLPYCVSLAVTEMMSSADMAFGMCPALSEGGIEAVMHHGTDELRELFLPNLVSGRWSATMDLTEAHAGTDLAAIRASAAPQPDGSYHIRGQKIFISFGDHDMCENIIHLVLARTPDAPPGSRGISCFIVPKRRLGPDGEPGEDNGIDVVSIEHKMGIHASPTCVLSYGDDEPTVGFLIGEENRGLTYMFTMMNRERLFVAAQGLAVAERAYQLARDYAREREQGKAVGLEGPGRSKIVDHADVRRMLLTMRASIEAMRGLLYSTAGAVDRARAGADEEARQRAEARLALLTPVAKAWLTDLGVEIASLGIQVHGGVGFVEETGATQQYRDARIAPIYEGTNGVQAMDLVSRKLPMAGGAVVRTYLEEMDALCAELDAAGERFAALRAALQRGIAATREASDWLLARASDEPRSLAAAATPYLRLLGTTSGAYQLARAALAAERDRPQGFEASFLTGLLPLAEFFATQLLPPACGLLPAITAGADALDALDPAQY